MKFFSRSSLSAFPFQGNCVSVIGKCPVVSSLSCAYRHQTEANSQTASSGGSNPVQQLYKSSHKGSGAVPMPKKTTPRGLGGKRTLAEKKAEELFTSRSSCAEDLGAVEARALSPLQKRQLLLKNKAAFFLSPQALRRVKFLLSQYEKNHPPTENGEKVEVPSGIHIGVRRRGCSGYSYTVNYHFDKPVDAEAEKKKAAGGTAALLSGLLDDVVVIQDGVKVVVDADALFYVIGTEMDYVVRNVEEKFTFKNPNQKYGCGCEESFMPFDEDDLDD